MNMNDLLNSLYAKDPAASSLEKTAEAKMLDELTQKGEVENPYDDLSLDELMKIASELNIDTGAATQQVPSLLQEEVGILDEKGPRVMAHAYTHEFGLMKQAMAQGLCRVCKTNPMDLEHTFVCSECLSDGEV